ncbi:MAG: ribosomal protein S19 family protein [Candidatus Nanoarchaeia archaeon]|nr:ribosomal protein S19 family protein [Candidatus Nanoarchaeia archaeon]
MVDVLHKGKEKSYRGIEIEELKKLDLREFAKLVKSRPRRAILRNYDILEKFVKRSEKKLAKDKLIKTHDRELIIVPKMVGKTIYIYNGKEYEKVLIIEQMLGHRLGEFALTRKIAKHTKAGVGATKSSASKKK